MSTTAEHHHDDDHHHQPSGLMRWVTTTNHKDIGTMYLLFSLTMFMIGGFMALIVRAELFVPGLQLVDPHFFNQMTTMHALIMVFGAIMPGMVGFANWQIPLMIGAPDMALPRLNNWSFWILPFAFTLILSGLFLFGGGPAGGWTLYAPLVLQGGIGVDLTIFAIHMMGISSIMGAINVVVTVLNMRAPGMTLMKMPLFVWTWLITAFLLIAVMPVFAGAVTMVLTDRHFGTAFFDPAGGGDPVLYQHIFWFFGHPEVYIMILPAFGIISEIIPTFSRKRLFGYDSMVFATAGIAFLSFIVWAHHMFTVGMPLAGELYFMYATMLIAVPTGVKVFNWVSTMWRGSMTFETPMLYAIAVVFLFTIGGLSGLMLAIVPADFQYHDTYFVVAHFHYVLFSGSAMAMMGGVFYWIPKWTGHMYNESHGKIHFWLTTIFFNLPLYNTLILLTSSVTCTFAHWAFVKGQRGRIIIWLAVTVALGCLFLYFQAIEYHEAYTAYGLTLGTGIYGSTFFMLTGFHGLHVTIGTLILFIVLLRVIRGHFTETNHFAFEGAAWYWHFVDTVWLLLFVFVYVL